jgi:hypothetical protein
MRILKALALYTLLGMAGAGLLWLLGVMCGNMGACL